VDLDLPNLFAKMQVRTVKVQVKGGFFALGFLAVCANFATGGRACFFS